MSCTLRHPLARILTLTAAALLLVAASAPARAFDEAEARRAAEEMRAAGMPESQIQAFLDSIPGAVQAAEQIESGAATRGITPADAERMALDRKRREFEAEFRDHPTTTVTVGDRRFDLKVVACIGTPDVYSVQAKGPPGESPVTLFANADSLGGRSISIRVGNDEFTRAKNVDERFDGSRYRFAGDLDHHVDFHKTGDKISSAVDLQCP